MYEPSKRRLTWPNGANATEPDALRGPQHDAAVCDELAKWQYAQETWDMLQFGLRTGSDPRLLISTTPRPTKLVKQIVADPGTVVTRAGALHQVVTSIPSHTFTASISYPRRKQSCLIGFRLEVPHEVMQGRKNPRDDAIPCA